MQVSDDLYLGPAYTNMGVSGVTSGSGGAGPSPQSLGVGPMGRMLLWHIKPTAPATNNICLSQAIAGAANAVIAGALASGGVATMDVARGLTMVSSSASDTTQTVTVTGTDQYGVAMSQVKTLNGTNAVVFTKAFKTVTRVAVSAVMVGNLTLGTRDAFGLPVFVEDAGYVASVKWNNTLADDAGTLTTGDKTFPATTSTTDVRGLYAPSTGAADGSKQLVMAILCPEYETGPLAIPYSTSATVFGALGVPQA